MRCPTCCGLGEVLIDRAGNIVHRLAEAVLLVPCPGCGGSGVGYCCDGLTACNDAPEPEDAEDAPAA
jgi:hypothetical protein